MRAIDGSRGRWFAGRKPAACLFLFAALGMLFASCSREGKERRASVHMGAANSYLKQGQVDEALVEFDKALALVPDDLALHLMIGGVYTHQERFDEAIEKFRYVLERDPQSAKAYELWGATLVLQGRLEEAVGRYRESVQLDPSAPIALQQLGMTLVRLRKPAEAISFFERAAELEAKPSADVLGYWGTALRYAGRLDEAISKYEAALRMVPAHTEAMNNLGLLLVERREESARGIDLLEEVARGRPADPRALQNLGWAYLQLERYEEAHHLLQRAVAASDPSDPEYAKHLEMLGSADAKLSRGKAGRDMPNVLLVVVDTLRADHVGHHGYAREPTPRIDAAARQGAWFEQAVSQAPWTAASVASLFTGLYPSVHGLDRGTDAGRGRAAATQKALSPSERTLAEMLRRRGYRTAAFVSSVYLGSIFGFSQGFDRYDEHGGNHEEGIAQSTGRAEEINERVFAWLEADPPEPFFLFVHYNDPHWPHDPPPPFDQKYVTDYRGEFTPTRAREIIGQRRESPDALAPEDLEYLIGLYDGEIAYADSSVGQLLDKIEALGFERKLLSVITSDHGVEFLDHGSVAHGHSLYEEQIHVPLIVRYPGRVRPARIEAQVRTIDVLPTVLELVGVDRPPGSLQGESLVPLMSGRTKTGPGVAYSEATHEGEWKSMRTGQGLKLISQAGAEAMLFDLTVDPEERSNLLKGDPSRGDRLQEDLRRWTESNRSVRGRRRATREVVLDEQTRSQLEALGHFR